MENDIGKKIAEAATRRVLGYGGAALAMHGITLSSTTTAMLTQIGIALLMAGGDMAWSVYDKYGRRWVTAKLEVMTATAELQAEQLRKARMPTPSAAEIAERVPDPNVTAAVVREVAAGRGG